MSLARIQCRFRLTENRVLQIVKTHRFHTIYFRTASWLVYKALTLFYLPPESWPRPHLVPVPLNPLNPVKGREG